MSQVQIQVPVTLYMIRNREGQWFRTVGFGRNSKGGKHWVDNPSDAKIYTKLRQARGRITWWARNYPAHGVPELIEITNVIATVVSEADRFAKAEREHKRKELRQTIRVLERRLAIPAYRLKNDTEANLRERIAYAKIQLEAS